MARHVRSAWVSAALALWATGAGAAERSWQASWGASPQAPTAANGPFAGSPTFHDQTIRQVVRLSGGGRQVRIRFTNEFGTAPLAIGGAHLARAAADGAIEPGSDHALTFAGKPSAVIPPGAPLYSDPVDMPVGPLTRLSISLYLPGQVDACTCHGTSVEPGYVTAGDATGAAAMPAGAAAPLLPRALISAVEVAPDGPAKTIVAFGDSITDGVGATPGADRRWPDQFAERLLAAGGPAVYVSDQGVSGNRVLNDGFGVNALARFDRDVLSVPGVSHVIVLLGTNDLGIGYGPARPGRPPSTTRPPSYEELRAGYRQLIARAHSRGVKIYAATIMPFEGASYWSPAGDAVRQTINDWMRTSKEWDGFIDFDAVWRDPAKPTQMKPGVGAADHLHGTDAGYAALGDAIPLDLFK